jgi:FkbM family methyltransferase
MKFKRWLKKIWFGNLPEGFRAFPYFGTRVHFPRNSVMFHVACEEGIYEWDNLRVLQAFSMEDTVVFDVGANIGLMAVPLLATNSKIAVHSFEPSPNSLPYLRRTVAGGGFGERWKLIEKAVGAEIGTVEFHLADKAHGAFDSVRNTERVAIGRSVKVPLTTLDAEWQSAGQPRISLIKIDVEGAERFALQGATACIARNLPAILLEWNASNLDAFECDPAWLLEFAERNDYSVLSVPSFTRVAAARELTAHMALTESFLLLPEDGPIFHKPAEATSNRLVAP